MNHLMIDLETLGVTPGCMILSIGAVGFDPKTETENFDLQEHLFYKNVGITQQQKAGLSFDASTFIWWLQQDKEAINALLSKQVPVKQALESFVSFWLRNGYTYIWSHGASFDVPILEHIMNVLEVRIPWKFWDIRDTRTLFDLAKVRPNRAEGTHHNALDDSIQQAKAVQKAYARLHLIDKREKV